MSESWLPYTLRDADSSLPVLLCLHGFLGRREDWDEVGNLLEGRFRLLTVDLPGHGENQPDDWSQINFDSVSTDLDDLLEQLRSESCHLLGYSMGGRLALYFAHKHPARCLSLTLESSSPGIASKRQRSARCDQDEELAKHLETVGMESFVADWYRQPLFSSLAKNESLLERIIQTRSDGNSGSLAAALRNLGTGRQPSLWKELAKIVCPVLIIAGEHDPKYCEITRKMADLFRRADVRIIPSAGHNVHLEQPELFAGTLYRFLERTQ